MLPEARCWLSISAPPERDPRNIITQERGRCQYISCGPLFNMPEWLLSTFNTVYLTDRAPLCFFGFVQHNPPSLSEERPALAPGIPVRTDIKAAIIAESAWAGDEATAAKYGISRRTIQRMRRALETDTELALALAVKQQAFEQRWLGDIDVTLGKAIRTIGEIAESVLRDPTAKRNPAMLHELTYSAKVLSDVKLAKTIIDARLAGLNPTTPPIGEDRQLNPGETQLAPRLVIPSPDSFETPSASEFAIEAELVPRDED